MSTVYRSYWRTNVFLFWPLEKTSDTDTCSSPINGANNLNIRFRLIFFCQKYSFPVIKYVYIVHFGRVLHEIKYRHFWYFLRKKNSTKKLFVRQVEKQKKNSILFFADLILIHWILCPIILLSRTLCPTFGCWSICYSCRTKIEKKNSEYGEAPACPMRNFDRISASHSDWDSRFFPQLASNIRGTKNLILLYSSVSVDVLSHLIQTYYSCFKTPLKNLFMQVLMLYAGGFSSPNQVTVIRVSKLVM